jgi:HEAT repeat protein
VGILRVVEWAAVALFGLTLLLFLLVLILRAGLLLRERRWRKFLAVWQPILINSIEVATADVPPLRSRDISNFLLLWNHLHESLLDEAKDHLNQVAHALNINQAALRMLRHGKLRGRLLAIITLGHLRERGACDALSCVTRDGGALLSVTAARALVMIDAERAIPELMPLLATRADWPAPWVANMLQIAGAEIISDQIATATIASCQRNLIRNTDGPVKSAINYPARMVRYLELAYNISALPAARAIAQSSADPEVLAACLRLLQSAEDLEIVRRCLTHEAWPVRVQAAAALGRIGEDEDEGLLIPLLSDRQWWVRYRAAQALARLPSMTEPGLKAIQAKQANPFARDMLAQVMAEIELQ